MLALSFQGAVNPLTLMVLAAFAPMSRAADDSCQQYTLKAADAFANGVDEHWIWQSGKEYVEQGSAKIIDNGIELALVTKESAATHITSKLQFQLVTLAYHAISHNVNNTLQTRQD